jgi:uncharacterized protein YndB with AHSA1/START domain
MGYIREITIDAPVDAVWRALTTAEQLERWLAPKAVVDLRIDGPYELYWGDRGDTRGCRVLAFEPEKSLRVEWRGKREFEDLFAPPHKLTKVEVRLLARDEATHVIVEQSETRHGRDWAAYDEWMAEAWESSLQSLRRLCESRDDSPYFRE